MKTPRFWNENHALTRVLTALSFLYRLGALADRRLTTAQAAPVPVLAIGNATAGGAGKTPTAIAIAQMLRQTGRNPHLISRGYKGAVRNVARVTPTDSWRIVGDEPLLLATAAPTWVGRNRLAAAIAAADAGADLVIADDALQHHALKKNASLLVIDGAYGIGNGRLLPAGPLREPFADALARADAVVLIGEDPHALTAGVTTPVFRARIGVDGDPAFLKESRWFAFAGLARPEKFYTTLREHGALVAGTRDFPDHYPYSAGDFTALIHEAQRLGARPITTPKDAVKIPVAYRKLISVLPVSLRFDHPEEVIAWLEEHGMA